MLFDDFGPTNRSRVCQPSGNTAGDTQTSSNNRGSALLAQKHDFKGEFEILKFKLRIKGLCKVF